MRQEEEDVRVHSHTGELDGRRSRQDSKVAVTNEIKGTNGAGDAYCSGILYGASQGWDLEKSMILATACAGCSLSEENGTDGMRSCQEVLDFYDSLASE